MDRKKDVHKCSKENLKGKPIPKLKEEVNTTKSVQECNQPSTRKRTAHSGIYFQLNLKKPIDSETESKHKLMDTSSCLTKKNESQRGKKEEKIPILPSMDKLDVSKELETKLRDTKLHISEKESAESVTSNQHPCKCCNRIKLLHAVCCSPQQQKTVKSQLPEVAKDAKESAKSERPAFWPPTKPTYKIIHTLDPSSAPVSSSPKYKSLSEENSEPLKTTKTEPSCLFETQTSSTAKTLRKSSSASRISRIPKFHPNSATDTKVPQKNSNPSGSKLSRNLKTTVVKNSSSVKRVTTAKIFCDKNEQKQTISTEKKLEVSEEKICK